MDLIFTLLTLLVNETTFNLAFQVVDDGRRLLPPLPPRETRSAKPSRVLRRLRESDDWKIRVLIDGEFTGVELDPQIILNYVRVVFHVDRDVLCVHGVRENRSSDILLRHRYFGCMRNRYWNCRPVEPISRSDRSDSRVVEPPSSIGDNESNTNAMDVPRPLGLMGGSEEHTSINSSQPNVRLTHQQVRPRHIPRPQGRYGQQISNNDDENNINSPQPNVGATRLRDIPQFVEPLRRPGEQTSTSTSDNAGTTYHQVRPRHIPRPQGRYGQQISNNDDENNINSPQPNVRATRLRDIPQSAEPPGRPGEQASTSTSDNDNNIKSPQPNARTVMRPRDVPRPLGPPMEIRRNAIKSLQPNEARPRDDESPMNVVEKDSFVHGIMLVLSLMIFIFMDFLF